MCVWIGGTVSLWPSLTVIVVIKDGEGLPVTALDEVMVSSIELANGWMQLQ